jgi:hypothetical protein
VDFVNHPFNPLSKVTQFSGGAYSTLADMFGGIGEQFKEEVWLWGPKFCQNVLHSTTKCEIEIWVYQSDSQFVTDKLSVREMT